jgi:acyl carrier protein
MSDKVSFIPLGLTPELLTEIIDNFPSFHNNSGHYYSLLLDIFHRSGPGMHIISKLADHLVESAESPSQDVTKIMLVGFYLGWKSKEAIDTIFTLEELLGLEVPSQRAIRQPDTVVINRPARKTARKPVRKKISRKV